MSPDLVDGSVVTIKKADVKVAVFDEHLATATSSTTLTSNISSKSATAASDSLVIRTSKKFEVDVHSSLEDFIVRCRDILGKYKLNNMS